MIYLHNNTLLLAIKYISLFFLLSFGNHSAAQTSRHDSIMLSDRLFAEGVDFFKSDRLYDAIPLFQRCDSIDAVLNYRLPYAKMWLAHCYSSKADFVEANTIYPHYYSVPPIDRRLTAISDILADKANDLMSKEEYKKAEKVWKKVAKMEKQTIGDSCFYYANTLYNLGVCQLLQGNKKEGLNTLLHAKNNYQLKSVKSHSYFPILSNLLNTIRQIYLSDGMRVLADSIAMEEAQNLREGIFGKFLQNDFRQMHLDYCNIDSIYKEVLGEFCIKRAELYDEWAQMYDMLFLVSKGKEIPFIKKSNITYSFVIDLYTICMYIWQQIPNHLYNEKYFEAGLNMATMYMRNNQEDKSAETIYQAKRLLAVYKDKNDTLYIKCLRHLSEFYERAHKPDSVYYYLQQAKDNYPSTLSHKDPLYIDIIENIAGYHQDKEEDDIAFQLRLEGVELKANNDQERLDGVLKTYNGYIICYALDKNLIKLVKYLKGRLALIEEHYGKDNSDYVSGMRMLGETYSGIGKYSQAIEASLFALDYYSHQTPLDSASILSCYRALKSCYINLGDNSKGRFYQKKYIDLSYKLNGKYDNGYINSLISLGIHSFYDNDTIAAEKYLGDAVDIAGSMHLDSEETLEAFSWYKWLMAKKSGNDTTEINKSIEFMEEAVKENDHPIWSPHIIAKTDAFYVLSRLYEMKSDWLRAIFYYQKDMKKKEGNGKPSQSSSYSHLARLFLKIGIKDSVTYYTLKAYNLEKTHIRDEISNMTSFEREMFWNDNASLFSRTIPRNAYLCHNDSLSVIAYNSALIYKGFLLSTDIELKNLIAESGDSALVKQYSKLQEEKDYLKLIKNGQIESGKYNVEQLERDMRANEFDIITKSKSLGEFTRNMTMTWNDIEAALNKDEVAIEFAGFTLEETVRYVAFVIRKGFTSPQMVSICTKEDIKSIKENDYYQTSQLYETIWKPLEKYIDGCKNIYFTPEGILYNIAIEYAVDDKGGAMSDNYHMYRLSSTREIAKNKNVINTYKSALFGGLQYTLDNVERERIKQIYNDSIPAEMVFRDSPNIRDLRESLQELPPLPGALREVEAVADIMKSHHHLVALETGTEGTEEAFKLLSGKHVNTLHISTHGFYDEEGDETSVDDEDQESSSLSRSGLFMSGASDYLNEVCTSADMEDGILTSKEISKMDFRGLDIVVLSACRTALGDISSEGVSGLQRGFKKAGAQSILMSLWKVDDEATCLLMTEFYKNWIDDGKTKRESLELAKQAVRSHKEKGWDAPKYWAAFILLDALD